MANDLFSNLGKMGNLGDTLGNLMGGLAKTGLVPKDTPEGKLLAAQSELSDFQKQESELLLEIGRQAYEQNPSAWPQDAKLKLIQQNIAAAQATLNEAKQAQEQADAAKAAEDTRTPRASSSVRSAGRRWRRQARSIVLHAARSLRPVRGSAESAAQNRGNSIWLHISNRACIAASLSSVTAAFAPSAGAAALLGIIARPA